MPQTVAAVSDISARGYARPEVLVSTKWVEEHRHDPKVRRLESNEDVLLYETGHIPGAVKIEWVTDLNDPLVRDYVDRARFERLLRAKGINNDTTIVFYGDKNNWWATYAFWVFTLFGVENLKILDGGRLRWADEGRELVTTAANYPEGNIKVRERDDSRIRTFRAEVEQHVKRRGKLVDVRSPEEYRGERLHMPEYPNEGALRGGHIPGAESIPCGRARAGRQSRVWGYRDDVPEGGAGSRERGAGPRRRHQLRGCGLYAEPSRGVDSGRAGESRAHVVRGDPFLYS